MKAIQLGYNYTQAELPVPAAAARVADGWRKTAGHIMIDGNTAAALGCVFAGATVGAWYPITPSTSLMDAYKGFCDRCASIRKPARRTSPSSRPRTSSPPSAWCSAHLERRARVHRHVAARASR